MAITLLRSPTIARRSFSTSNSGLWTRVPRTRFNFFASFQLSSGGLAMMGDSKLDSNSETGVSFKVKTVDKPKITMVTEEMNQYNKKVLIYKKVDYGEASIRLHDTVDDSVLKLWMRYFTYYFGDSRDKSNSAAYTQSPVSANFIDDSGWGFRPVTDVTRFFDRITIYALFARTYTSFSYISPRITSIDWQQKDYSSSDPEEVTITFKYESVRYESFGQPISDDQMSLFGWDSPNDYINREQLNNVQTPVIPTYGPVPGSQASVLTTALSQVLPPSNNIGTAPGLTPGASVPVSNIVTGVVSSSGLIPDFGNGVIGV